MKREWGPFCRLNLFMKIYSYLLPAMILAACYGRNNKMKEATLSGVAFEGFMTGRADHLPDSERSTSISLRFRRLSVLPESRTEFQRLGVNLDLGMP